MPSSNVYFKLHVRAPLMSKLSEVFRAHFNFAGYSNASCNWTLLVREGHRIYPKKLFPIKRILLRRRTSLSKCQQQNSPRVSFSFVIKLRTASSHENT